MVRPQASRSRRVALPHDDFAGLDAGLLKALRYGHDEHGVGGDAFAAEAVDLETDDLADGNDALPGFDGVVAAGVGGDGAVEEIKDALFVELASGVVEGGIARYDDLGFGVLGFLVEHGGEAKLAL